MIQPKRPAIYARVSTTDQDCELQLRELREFVRCQRWPQATEFVEQISGTKGKRPALDRLMEAAAQRQIDCVLVWKIDRFGRSVLNLSQHLAALDAAGVRFVATSQGLDTDRANPASRLLLLILAAIAEFERELILERSAVGRNKKLEAGRPDSWSLGWGFAVEGGAPRIVDKEAEILTQIFLWRQEGKSYRNIAGLLQNLGVRPRTAAYWSPRTIQGMLQNRCYIGEYWRCGHVWPVPPITRIVRRRPAPNASSAGTISGKALRKLSVARHAVLPLLAAHARHAMPHRQRRPMETLHLRRKAPSQPQPSGAVLGAAHRSPRHRGAGVAGNLEAALRSGPVPQASRGPGGRRAPEAPCPPRSGSKAGKPQTPPGKNPRNGRSRALRNCDGRTQDQDAERKNRRARN